MINLVKTRGIFNPKNIQRILQEEINDSEQNKLIDVEDPNQIDQNPEIQQSHQSNVETDFRNPSEIHSSQNIQESNAGSIPSNNSNASNPLENVSEIHQHTSHSDTEEFSSISDHHTSEHVSKASDNIKEEHFSVVSDHHSQIEDIDSSPRTSDHNSLENASTHSSIQNEIEGVHDLMEQENHSVLSTPQRMPVNDETLDNPTPDHSLEHSVEHSLEHSLEHSAEHSADDLEIKNLSHISDRDEDSQVRNHEEVFEISENHEELDEDLDHPSTINSHHSNIADELDNESKLAEQAKQNLDTQSEESLNPEDFSPDIDDVLESEHNNLAETHSEVSDHLHEISSHSHHDLKSEPNNEFHHALHSEIQDDHSMLSLSSEHDSTLPNKTNNHTHNINVNNADSQSHHINIPNSGNGINVHVNLDMSEVPNSKPDQQPQIITLEQPEPVLTPVLVDPLHPYMGVAGVMSQPGYTIQSGGNYGNVSQDNTPHVINVTNEANSHGSVTHREEKKVERRLLIV